MADPAVVNEIMRDLQAGLDVANRPPKIRHFNPCMGAVRLPGRKPRWSFCDLNKGHGGEHHPFPIGGKMAERFSEIVQATIDRIADGLGLALCESEKDGMFVIEHDGPVWVVGPDGKLYAVESPPASASPVAK